MTTTLNKQEKKWILEKRVTRFYDNKEVQIYPMGAEIYLSSALFGNKKDRYNIRTDIEGKDVLVIPGHGNSGFLFAQAGAKSITVYDKDPITIAWMKAFKKYYHYREYDDQGKPYPSIGELMTALTRWYPPLITLPHEKYKNILFWTLLKPKLVMQSYILYMVSLTRHAVQSKIKGDFELDKNIQFYVGEVNQLINKKKQVFDTAFVPYLLGVQNGIEKEKDIIDFIKKLTQLVPIGHILVSPSQNKKEFYMMGKSYFVTTDYSNIVTIPELVMYVIREDKNWHNTQGLAIFCAPDCPVGGQVLMNAFQTQ